MIVYFIAWGQTITTFFPYLISFSFFLFFLLSFTIYDYKLQSLYELETNDDTTVVIIGF